MNRQSHATRETLKAILDKQCDAFFTEQKEPHPFFDLIRQQSYRTFRAHALPTQKDESYRYTPLVEELTPLFTQGISSCMPGAIKPRLHTSIGEMEGYKVTFCNGKLVDKGSKGNTLPFGLYPLAEAYKRYPHHCKQYFHQQAREGNDPWVMLNSVLFEEGYFLYIPARTVLTKPILIHHYISADRPAARYPRTFLMLDAHSRATVIETYSADSESGEIFVNSVTEIVLAPHGHLTHYPLHIDQSPTHTLSYTYVRQAAQSQYDQYLAVAPRNAPFARHQTTLSLEGEKAGNRLHGIYRSHASQHLALHTAVHHQSADTTTHQSYLGSGNHTSTTLFDGHIYIPPQSQQVKATQQHKGWILSGHAAIHARPQLSIQADDVQCSHGSTTQQIDAATLTYMQARGLPQADAKRLLLQGFFEQAIQAIPSDAIQKIMRKILV